MEIVEKIKTFIQELKNDWARLKLNVKLSQLEVEMYRRLEEHTDQFQQAVQEELRQLKTVDQNYSIESFEDDLTSLQVFLETGIDDELQRIERNNQKLKRATQRPNCENYHSEFSQTVEEIVQTEREEAQRMAESIDSVVERLDVNADPAEMARLLDQVGEENTQNALQKMNTRVSRLKTLIANNRVMRYYSVWRYFDRMDISI